MRIGTLLCLFLLGCSASLGPHDKDANQKDSGNLLKLNSLDYFETRGLNVFAFSNWYDVNFFDDSKLSGIEIIHHGVRTATNGDVRLNPTPEQWDPTPKMVQRDVNKEQNCIETTLAYPDYNFVYTVKAQARGDGILINVNIDKQIPAELVGRAGFNLEFLPAAYFEKTYLMDGKPGVFPAVPVGTDGSGKIRGNNP